MNNSSITLNIKQLSAEINYAVKTIRSLLVNNPNCLPPRLIIEGQKGLRWLRTDVIDFYDKQKRSHGSNPQFSSLHQNQAKVKNHVNVGTVAEKKKRGRPPIKLEEKAKRLALDKRSAK